MLYGAVDVCFKTVTSSGCAHNVTVTVGLPTKTDGLLCASSAALAAA